MRVTTIAAAAITAFAVAATLPADAKVMLAEPPSADWRAYVPDDASGYFTLRLDALGRALERWPAAYGADDVRRAMGEIAHEPSIAPAAFTRLIADRLGLDPAR